MNTDKERIEFFSSFPLYPRYPRNPWQKLSLDGKTLGDRRIRGKRNGKQGCAR
jgi:hypothetical protein